MSITSFETALQPTCHFYLGFIPIEYSEYIRQKLFVFNIIEQLL